MPITVKHAPSSAMEALAGLMGGMGRGAESELEARREAGQLTAQLDARQTAQTQQLGAQRAMQREQIEAQADRQREAADTAYARTALSAGLQEKIQEQQFDNEVRKMKEAARIEANKFEWKFSVASKRKIAANNSAKQFIRSSDAFNKEQKAEAIRMIDLDTAGIDMDAMPSEKTSYPQTKDGQSTDVGRSWKDSFGNIHTREPDGKDRVQVTYDKTQEGIQQKHRLTMELKAAEQEAEDRKVKAEVRRELLMDKDPVSGARTYTPVQVETEMQRLFPSVEVGQLGPTDIELEQELQRRVDEQTPWWEAPVRQGRRVLDAEKEAPPQVGQALMYAREAMEKYKTADKIPSAVIAEIQRSKLLINQWRQSRSSVRQHPQGRGR